ncbi:MAG: transcriptional repressor [Anaerolineae bacterium]|nr:transcriptional repressor [Anaerolineae bacterium]
MNDPKRKIPSENAEEIIREAGHRLTPQRQVLLDLLRAHKTFLDADQIYELTLRQEGDTSLATVYRSLQLFVELGLVEARYLDPEHKREYYRIAGGLEYHYLTCRGCGMMIPVDPEVIQDVALQWANAHGLTLLTAHACYTGYCADCTARRKERTTANPG